MLLDDGCECMLDGVMGTVQGGHQQTMHVVYCRAFCTVTHGAATIQLP